MNMNTFSSSLPSSLSSISGSQLLNSIRPHPLFQTGHSSLDRLLTLKQTHKRKLNSHNESAHSPAGISRQQHLQVEGSPGVGKTKFAIGLAVRARAQSLVSKRADAIEVLYIDADGSASASLFELSAKSLTQEIDIGDEPNLVDGICDGIHLVRITTTAELGFFFRSLPRWLTQHSKTKLIVLDSITAHSKYVSMTISDRYLIGQYIREGIKAATIAFNCTIIVTAQPTSKRPTPDQTILVTPDFKPSSEWSSSAMVHKLRMVFEHDGSRRVMVIEQDTTPCAPGRMKGEVRVAINEIGIFDPTEATQSASAR